VYAFRKCNQYLEQLAPQVLQTATHPTCGHVLLVLSSVQSMPWLLALS
jgi:hypothetical protein